MNDLLLNINRVHTTKLGLIRIGRNLHLNNIDVVSYCKEKILKRNCHIYKKGKNYYCEVDNIKITVNSSSYSIITAHIIN